MRVIGMLLAVVLAFGVLGCNSQPTNPDPVRLETPRVERDVSPRWETVGSSVEGRSIRCWIAGTGAHKVLYMGCIHGDEPGSRTAVEDVRAYMESHPKVLAGRTVVVMPLANPDGYARGTRRNARGVDLNRNFPTRNYQAGSDHGSRATSEPETRAFCELLREHDFDVVVAVHAPLACVDYDGPAMGLAHRMSRRCGYPVKKLGARAGSLGSYAGIEKSIAIITLELPGDWPAEAGCRESTTAALLEALSTASPGHIGVARDVPGMVGTIPAR